MKQRIVVLSDVYYTNKSTKGKDDVFMKLNDIADVRFDPSKPGDLSKKELRDASAVVVGHLIRIDEEFLKSAPRLKVVARFGVGYNNIAIKACTKRRVYVTYTPGVLSNVVAELTMGLVLCLAKGFLKADRYVRTKWTQDSLFPLSSDVNGKVLGIIGLGQIGKAVAKRAKGFDMDIIYFSRNRKKDIEKEFGVRFMELEKLLQISDFVTVHVPLTNSTRHLIGQRELRLMKNTSYLINTSRGQVIDETSLYRALEEEWIAGAGLDVFTKEPIPLNHPILKKQNVLLTPHMGSGTVETRRRMAEINIKDIKRVLQKKAPLNLVPEQK